MKDFQYITNAHPSYIENLYQDFVKDPQSVDSELRKFFEGFDFAVSHAPQAVKPAQNGQPVAQVSGLDKEFAVFRLIKAYRKRGHLIAKTNPIRERKDRQANLDLAHFGLSEADLDTLFESGNFAGLGKVSLRNILDHLNRSYAYHVGAEFTYINDERKVEWLIRAMEKDMHQPVELTKKRRILEKLNQGVMFEKFLHTKYIGQKRFSLEGGETTIAALDAILNTAAGLTVEEVAIGMAHRGRLNVLANILGVAGRHVL